MAVADVLPSPGESEDKPRVIVAPVARADLIFRGVLRAAGLIVLVITASILIFLVGQSLPAFRAVGFEFLTNSQPWSFATKQFGIGAILPDSVMIALIALVIAFPMGVATALFISEYAPQRLRKALIATIDLMAAVPSIIVGMFGFFFVMPRIIGFDAWLAHHLGFIPFFHFTEANLQPNFETSIFIAGVVVSILVIPIITSLSRQVFSQAPQGEREAAYALGSTRLGMIRTVVLPYGRSGVIGAGMLGLGRALGETIAVSFILTLKWGFSPHVLEAGGNSVTYMIASQILGAYGMRLSALMAAGLVLFVLTLFVNTGAAVIISRSRSGASASAD